jgi:hypothetical protein
MGAFAEARYFAWERLEGGETFPVKGHSLNAEQILGQASSARSFVGGPVLLVRLAPVDYHHVHYPDDGRTLSQHRLGLWTVNWHALQNKPDILFASWRQGTSGGSHSSKWGPCRSGASSRFIQPTPPSSEARKSRSSALAAPPSLERREGREKTGHISSGENR